MRAVSCGLLLWLNWAGVSTSPRAQTASVEVEWRRLTEAQAAYQRGISWAERGDIANAGREWDAAMAGFLAVMQMNPMRSDLYALVADIHIRKGHPAVAYALLTQQIRGGTSELALRIQVVRALRAMNRRSKAMSLCGELRKERPQDADIGALHAELLAEDGQSDQALSMLGPLLSKLPVPGRHPGLDGVTMGKLHARLLIAKSRGSEAVAGLTELLAKQPNDPEAQLLLGQAQIAAGKHTEAVATLRKYLVQFPRDGRARAALGKALADSGQLLAGIEELEHADDVPEALLELGQLYLRKLPPDSSAALAALTKAQRLQPQDLRICVELSKLRDQQAGQAAQALADIERCTERLLGTDGGLDGLAQKAVLLRLDLQIKNGKFDAAMATWKGLKERYPGLNSLQAKLAQALLRRGLSKLPVHNQTSKAGLPDLLEAHRLAPSLATAQALALGQIGAGEPQEALATLQNHLKDGANEPRFLGAYGRALRDAGQASEALLVLQKGEGLTSSAPANQALKLGLRQEIALCYLQLQQPRLALRYLEGNDELSQQLRAQASLVSARMLFSTAAPGTTPSFQQVMFVTQAVLRGGTAVLAAQKAEAKLWQVLALAGSRQIDVAVKLLAEVVQLFDVASLEQTMGRGGLPHLQARLFLRFGDFTQATQLAQQALPHLPPQDAKVLREVAVSTLNNKAIEISSKGDHDRAAALLRLAQTQALPGQVPAQVFYNQAVLWILRGRLDEAKLFAAKLDPAHVPDAWVLQGAIAEAQGDPRAALELYRRYVQNGTGPQLATVRGWVDSLARFYEGAAPSPDVAPAPEPKPVQPLPLPTKPVKPPAKPAAKPILKRRPR